MEITERQRKLLRAIINEFIETAEAVASLHLPDKYNLPISSATIRNEMKALSDAGYLKQLHTSSGRVPTSIAMRLFLEDMLTELQKLEQLELIEQERIRHHLYQRRFRQSELIHEALRMISRLTGCVGLMLVSDNVHFAGLAEALEMPEFQDLAELQKLLNIIENPAVLAKTLGNARMDTPVKVLVGEELGEQGLTNFAMVFVSVRLHDNIPAVLVAVGPARMDYRKVIPVMSFLSEVINQATRMW